jgi:hypothetical protein
VLVPAGWDSWGKIAVLNETFDCRGVAGVSWSELKGVYGQSVREKKGVESVGLRILGSLRLFGMVY